MGNTASTPPASVASSRKQHTHTRKTTSGQKKRHAHTNTPHASRSQLPRPSTAKSLPTESKTRRNGAGRQHSASPPRPPPLNRSNSVHTRYMQMLLHLDEVPRLHNILAAFFTWLLLSGFVIFPATYVSLQKEQPGPNHAERVVLNAVKNVPLLWVAAVCSITGAFGMVALWIMWRRNYIWVINRIFLPGALNGLTGLITTLVNVYTAQDHIFSLTARITTIVTGSCLIINMVLFIMYNNWALDRVRRHHYRVTDAELAERRGEGFVHKMSRKAHEKPLIPGSVV